MQSHFAGCCYAQTQQSGTGMAHTNVCSEIVTVTRLWKRKYKKKPEFKLVVFQFWIFHPRRGEAEGYGIWIWFLTLWLGLFSSSRRNMFIKISWHFSAFLFLSMIMWSKLCPFPHNLMLFTWLQHVNTKKCKHSNSAKYIETDFNRTTFSFFHGSSTDLGTRMQTKADTQNQSIHAPHKQTGCDCTEH